MSAQLLIWQLRARQYRMQYFVLIGCISVFRNRDCFPLKTLLQEQY